MQPASICDNCTEKYLLTICDTINIFLKYIKLIIPHFWTAVATNFWADNIHSVRIQHFKFVENIRNLLSWDMGVRRQQQRRKPFIYNICYRKF